MIIMVSTAKPVDFVKMFNEIKVVREKFNMPKGLLFVPDKLEISVQRISSDNFHLSYKEFFSYLPNQVIDKVIPMTINLLVQIGIPRERITRIDGNGVGVEIDGNLLQIGSSILSELLIQKRLDDAELSSFFNSVQETRKVFVELGDFEFEWNSEIEKMYYGILENLSKVMRDHPSALAEIEAIVKRYTQPSENKSDETENNQKP